MHPALTQPRAASHRSQRPSTSNCECAEMYGVTSHDHDDDLSYGATSSILAKRRGVCTALAISIDHGGGHSQPARPWSVTVRAEKQKMFRSYLLHRSRRCTSESFDRYTVMRRSRGGRGVQAQIGEGLRWFAIMLRDDDMAVPGDMTAGGKVVSRSLRCRSARSRL